MFKVYATNRIRGQRIPVRCPNSGKYEFETRKEAEAVRDYAIQDPYLGEPKIEESN